MPCGGIHHSRKAEHGRLIQGFANQARHYLSSIISWWQNGSCWFSKRSLSRSSTIVMNLALIPKDCYHRSTRRRWCICKEFTACQVRWFVFVTTMTPKSLEKQVLLPTHLQRKSHPDQVVRLHLRTCRGPLLVWSKHKEQRLMKAMSCSETSRGLLPHRTSQKKDGVESEW